jgi:hypothetical protein
MRKTIREGLFLPLFLCLCLTSNAARADEPSPNKPSVEMGEVRLKNGDSVRGTIVTVSPGDRVIVIVAGEKSVIPWDKVAQVADAPTRAAATNPTDVKQGLPLVHIESDLRGQKVELRAVDAATSAKPICVEPCDKVIEGREGQRFVVTHPSMIPSSAFRLQDINGNVRLRVQSAYAPPAIMGVSFTAFGGIAMVAGTGLFIDSYMRRVPTPQNPNPEPEKILERGIGIPFFVIGAVFLSFGLTWLLPSNHTRVEIIKTARGEPKLVFDHGVFRF